MRTYFTSLACLMAFVVFFSGSVHAQEKKHEIGIHLLSVGAGTSMVWRDFYTGIGKPSVFSGVHYKRIFNHSAIRSSISVVHDSYSPNPKWECWDCREADYNLLP